MTALFVYGDCRKLNVLELVGSGLTHQEIADRLVVALNTVKTNIRNNLA
jgi:ATP/maltotriose-dependent transcriptional regulator MalT